MDVNVNVKEQNECLELMPFSVYVTDANLKDRISTAIREFIDVIAGFLGVLLLIPITFIIFIAKKITKDEGPIFYKQWRIGRNGKPFQIYKYITNIKS